eukprot:925004-Prymnesium_polylepis.1
MCISTLDVLSLHSGCRFASCGGVARPVCGPVCRVPPVRPDHVAATRPSLRLRLALPRLLLYAKPPEHRLEVARARLVDVDVARPLILLASSPALHPLQVHPVRLEHRLLPIPERRRLAVAGVRQQSAVDCNIQRREVCGGDVGGKVAAAEQLEGDRSPVNGDGECGADPQAREDEERAGDREPRVGQRAGERFGIEGAVGAHKRGALRVAVLLVHDAGHAAAEGVEDDFGRERVDLLRVELLDRGAYGGGERLVLERQQLHVLVVHPAAVSASTSAVGARRARRANLRMRQRTSVCICDG